MDAITPRMDGTPLERALFRIRALREALNDIRITDTRVHADAPAKIAELSLSADDRRAAASLIAFTEEDCPGHIASAGNPKICGRCGIHIDSLRPMTDAGI